MQDFISPFTDVPVVPITKPKAPQRLNDTKEFQIGFGSEVIRGDRQGMWLGAKTFTEAPFRVNMQGQIYTQSPSGSMVFDGVNNRILISDLSNDRVVIGQW